MRSSGADESLKLSPPKKMSLENFLEFVAEDELVEITPNNIRLRNKNLDHNARKRAQRK